MSTSLLVALGVTCWLSGLAYFTGNRVLALFWGAFVATFSLALLQQRLFASDTFSALCRSLGVVVLGLSITPKSWGVWVKAETERLKNSDGPWGQH
jgi:hypothetical protein